MNVVHMATITGNLDLVKELAPLAGEGICDEDSYGRNCLDIAKDEEHLSVAVYLASSFPALMRKVRLTCSNTYFPCAITV